MDLVDILSAFDCQNGDLLIVSKVTVLPDTAGGKKAFGIVVRRNFSAVKFSGKYA
jgi:hypothetical protein